MKLDVELQIKEYDGVLSGYTVLLVFRLMNLCVKAEPASLLPAVVLFRGAEKKIEEVANVGVMADDQLDVYPFHDELLVPIGKAIMDVHPEFRQELKNVKIENQEKELNFIRLHMPEVNDDRKKVLLDGVDNFAKVTKEQLDATKSKYKVRVDQKLYKSSKDEIEEAKNRMDELYDQYSKRADKAVEDKKKEIEEAYQLWLEKKAQKQMEMQEQQAASGDDVKSSMKMPQANG
jgi:ribosome recycling factor